MITIKGVSIGDKFKRGNIISEVIDIYEKKSLINGDVKGYICIAKGINCNAQNEFDVPFSTVVRYRI